MLDVDTVIKRVNELAMSRAVAAMREIYDGDLCGISTLERIADDPEAGIAREAAKAILEEDDEPP